MKVSDDLGAKERLVVQETLQPKRGMPLLSHLYIVACVRLYPLHVPVVTLTAWVLHWFPPPPRPPDLREGEGKEILGENWLEPKRRVRWN